LDEGIAVLRAGLAVWSRTAILVVTEFGRTVRVNGTGGTPTTARGLQLS
jgi:uncharacterized protein (DUF1501 family)